MIPTSHMQEHLSQAYVKAVAARAGYAVQFNEGCDYGVDGQIREVHRIENRYRDSGFILDFQLKCTKNVILQDAMVSYDLEVKNYNDFVERAQDGSAPLLLIVYHLPEDPEKWLEVSEEKLIMRKCCYWSFLKDAQSTSHKATQRIHIPKDQFLTIHTVGEIMNSLRGGLTDV